MLQLLIEYSPQIVLPLPKTKVCRKVSIFIASVETYIDKFSSYYLHLYLIKKYFSNPNTVYIAMAH